MKKTVSESIRIFFTPLLISLFVAGCATLDQKAPETARPDAPAVPEAASPDMKAGPGAPGAPGVADRKLQSLSIEEIKARIKEYETRREFRKALQAWKQIQAADPSNAEAQRMVAQLETGLKAAVQRHLRLGMTAFDEGNIEKSRKELLLVLFLDSGQKEALDYLRRLTLLETSPQTVRMPKELLPFPDQAGGYTLHTIQSGESLSIVAEKYYGDKMKYQTIAEFNAISDVTKIRVGQTIKVPALKGTAPSLAPPTEPVAATRELPNKPAPDSGASNKSVPGKSPSKQEPQKPAVKEVSAEQRINHGKKLYQENKFDEALAEFQELTRVFPDNNEAMEYMVKSQVITARLKRGASFYDSKEYESAYDEFGKVLLLKPDVVPVKQRVESLVPLLVTKARHLLREEQSPCETILLTKKILQGIPTHHEAKKLFDEAVELEKGLELQCGGL